MKINITFRSVKDLSPLSYGENLLAILEEFGLVIEKANDVEPINKPFERQNFPQMWNAKSDCIDCTFLFKGNKEVSFSGMASWIRNVHANSTAYCGVTIWFHLKKSYDVNKLLQLGDALFVWCDAFYGSITEHSKDLFYKDTDYTHARGMLYQLCWANYFGTPYLNEPDFHIPADSIKVGNGVRFMMADSPNDKKLSDPAYLQSRKQEIGTDWFWVKPENIMQDTSIIKVPFIDRSEIRRKEE